MKGVLLKDYSTFKIGGEAKYFELVGNIFQLKKAILFAKEKEIPIFILGGGSNILFSDKGFDGLVIKLNNAKYKIKGEKIVCGAGMSLGQLVGIATENNLTGLEWAAGIPGTVGGAVFGNAGVLGEEMKDVIKSVKIFNIKRLEEKLFNWEQCKFFYRNSFFKEKKEELVIVEVELVLREGDKKEIKETINKNILHRKDNQPLNFPSAGSTFKNVNLTEDLIKKFPDFGKFRDRKNIPAAYLIDKCGLKGIKIGGAQISEKQPNFILNIKDAKAKDVLNLINLITEKVKNKFGILLEKEIIII